MAGYTLIFARLVMRSTNLLFGARCVDRVRRRSAIISDLSFLFDIICLLWMRCSDSALRSGDRRQRALTTGRRPLVASRSRPTVGFGLRVEG